jgi:hypothetical protein
MQTNTSHTTFPDSPIEDFNSWYRNIVLQQEQEGEIRRYKRDIEASFEMLHNSITNGNLKRQ